jgi:hypothetical protein
MRPQRGDLADIPFVGLSEIVVAAVVEERGMIASIEAQIRTLIAASMGSRHLGDDAPELGNETVRVARNR